MSQRTALASNSGTSAASGLVAARSLSTTASATDVSRASAAGSMDGTRLSWSAVAIGLVVGAGGRWPAQAAMPTSEQQTASDRIMWATGGCRVRNGLGNGGLKTHDS